MTLRLVCSARREHVSMYTTTAGPLSVNSMPRVQSTEQSFASPDSARVGNRLDCIARLQELQRKQDRTGRWEVVTTAGSWLVRFGETTPLCRRWGSSFSGDVSRTSKKVTATYAGRSICIQTPAFMRKLQLLWRRTSRPAAR